jgi:prepilin-type processing-associated H-X9-DG protein
VLARGSHGNRLCPGLFNLVSPREHPRVRCAANLSAIGGSCLTYAEANGGSLPVSLDVLTYGKRAYLQPKQLFCQVCDGAFIYVPGHTNQGDPTEILAYEPLSYHKGEGGNVLRLDGSVKWRSGKDYDEAMARVKAHLRSIPNLPAQ